LIQWHPQLIYTQLEIFANAIEKVGGAKEVWGFVNGTFHRHYCPQDNKEQQQVYSKHKKLHKNNYQAIVTPDELVSSLVDLFIRPTANWTIWQQSGCEEAIQQIIREYDLLWLYNDAAYQASYKVAVP
jgi:hypothetical protein